MEPYILKLFTHGAAFLFGMGITFFLSKKIPEALLFFSEVIIIIFWSIAMYKYISSGTEMPISLTVFFAAVLGSLSEKINQNIFQFTKNFFNKK